jgi:hypothetical protein
MASTEKIEAFLAEPRNVVVAGIRRDGRPQLTPNWFRVLLAITPDTPPSDWTAWGLD